MVTHMCNNGPSANSSAIHDGEQQLQQNQNKFAAPCYLCRTGTFEKMNLSLVTPVVPPGT